MLTIAFGIGAHAHNKGTTPITEVSDVPTTLLYSKEGPADKGDSSDPKIDT